MRAFLPALAFILLASPARGLVPPVPVTPGHASGAVEAVYESDDARVDEILRSLAHQDIVHCSLDVCIDPARARVRCGTDLSVVAFDDSIVLALDSAYAVRSVTDGAGRAVDYDRRGDILVARLNGPGRGDTLALHVEHDGLIDPSSEHVWWSAGFVYLNGAGRWYPSPPLRDVSTYSITARCPSGYSTVCTGVLAGMAATMEDAEDECTNGDVWRVTTPVPFVDAVVGQLDTSMGIWRDVFLAASWYAPAAGRWSGGGALGPANPTAAAKTAVRFLEACFGPYPYDWLNVVSAPPEASGGRTSASGPGVVVVAGLESRVPAAQLPDPDSYISELARNWWSYSMDSGELVAGGLGAQAEIMWVEATRDEGEAVRTREFLQAQYARALAESGRGQPLSTCVGPSPVGDERVCRGKGSAVFSVLDRMVGHESYCRAMRALSDEHRGDELRFRDFMAVFEGALGSSLDWFVYEWICRSGLPTYELEYESTPIEGGFAVRGVINQEGEVYRTPLPLTIDLGGWAYEEWVVVDSAAQHFEILTDVEPLEIVIDASRRIPTMDQGLRAAMHYERGASAAVKNDWALAVDEFGEAVLVSPESAEYRYSYGEALVRFGRLNEGLDSLEAAVVLDPFNADYRLWLAHLYLGAGNYGAALVHLESYIELRPDDAASQADRVLALVGLKRLSEAEDGIKSVRILLESGAVSDSAAEKFHLASGWYHEATGDTAAAASDYRRALDVNPVSDEARGRLAALGRAYRTP